MFTRTTGLIVGLCATLTAFHSSTANAQASPNDLVFGTDESVPFATLLQILGVVPGVNTTVTVSAAAAGPWAASADLTGDGRLTCRTDNNNLVFEAGQGPAASATCHARACTVTLGLITICQQTTYPLRSVACEAGNDAIDRGCTSAAPACDDAAEPTCVGCTDDTHCGAASGFVAATVGQVVRVTDDLLRNLLGVSATALLTDVQVSADVNGPFTDEALVGSDVACTVTTDDRVEVVAGANADAQVHTCYVRACVPLLGICTTAPLDILVDLCLVGGTCNPVATCDTATHACVACRDDRGPGLIDSGCNSGSPSCHVDESGASCVACAADADCEASLLSTLLGPGQQVTVGLAEVLEFLRLSTALLPSNVAVSSRLDTPFSDEAVLGADVAVANCAVGANGDITITANAVEAQVTCYIQVCTTLLGQTVETCVTAPLDVDVNACVLSNTCNIAPVCLDDSTCASCADTASAGSIDRGCDGDVPACDGGSCVECLEDADCTPRFPLLDLDLGETGLIDRDLVLASLGLAANALIDSLNVSATLTGPFSESALLDVEADLAQCEIDLDGNIRVISTTEVYGQVTCYVQACVDIGGLLTNCLVAPIEINVDPCATHGNCRPPICGADNRCVTCDDTVSGGIDAGCDEVLPACHVGSGTTGAGECVECTLDADCDGDQVCDPTTNTCVVCEDTVSGGVDEGCDEVLPACHVGSGTTGAGECVECTLDADCDGDQVCNPTTNTCVDCLDTGSEVDAGCTPEQPLCEGSGDDSICTTCIDDTVGDVDSGCGLEAPACDETATAARCEECTVDPDCEDGLVCDSSNHCVECADGVRGNCGPVNAPPVAFDDAALTPEDTRVLIVVATNDTDSDGQALTPRAISAQPLFGAASMLTDGTVLYVPMDDFFGLDFFSYEVCDELGACDVGTVRVEVTPVNDAPNAFDDFAQTPAETTVAVDVLDNDVDRDGDSLVVTQLLVANGSGTATIDDDGNVEFAPASADPDTTVSITYMACDPEMACESALLTIIVGEGQAPQMPNVNDDAAETTSGVRVAIDVLANDVGPAGLGLMVATWSNGAHGFVALDAQGLSYVPALGFTGEDTFRYAACTADGRCGAATVTVSVGAGLNAPPLAFADLVTTLVDTAVDFDPTSNDIDPEGGDLTVTFVSMPEFGSTEPGDGNLVTYTPSAAYVGEDIFAVEIADPEGLTATSTVRVIVLESANTAPVAVDDTLVLELGAEGILDVLANDSDPDSDPLTIVEVQQPSNGTALFVAGELPEDADAQLLVVRMNDGFVGRDSFAYRISDGRGGFALARVDITVVEPSNTTPIVADDDVELDEDTVVDIDVLANDSDPDGDALTISSFAVLPQNGSVQVVGSGLARYVPAANYFGEDNFVYVACDARGECAEGDVLVTVLPVNDAPVAVDDGARVNPGSSTSITVLGNDTDPDGDALTLTAIVLQPLEDQGGASIDRDLLVYSAPRGFRGQVTVRYEVCDPSGACDEADVTIEVDTGNVGTPNAMADTASLEQDTSVLVDVLANDSHATVGVTLTLGAFTVPTNGAVVRIGSALRYTPSAGFVGLDVFYYDACDSMQQCATASVTLTVTATVPTETNRAPEANDDMFVVMPDSTTVLDVLANDTDADGDVLRITRVRITNDAPLGTVTLEENGDIRYQAGADLVGEDLLEYTVCDVHDACNTGTATVGILSEPKQMRVTGGPTCTGGGIQDFALVGLALMLVGMLRRRSHRV